ncbi:hypothetical protein [Sinomonas sp. ASV322]|uniref:hypothetical protein n=1 Tax=Sinomonas sp. ASV322 TaxID=3041920 RepID=UPI0027DC9EA8|nr:hypothetical protein [Sinomonas sp. ASV322]MDQ4504320.1 hypothetical protein [Sinomonas sp. ASV322]
MADSKKSFLVAYDYGMGGLWGIIFARSAEEILALYPELQIATERPPWMTDERYARLEHEEFHDIDGAPWGILNAVLADRRHE